MNTEELNKLGEEIDVKNYFPCEGDDYLLPAIELAFESLHHSQQQLLQERFINGTGISDLAEKWDVEITTIQQLQIQYTQNLREKIYDVLYVE